MMKRLLYILLLLFPIWEVAGQTSGIPKEYDPRAFSGIVSDFDRRLSLLEHSPGNIIVSASQPKGSQGKLWYKPHAKELYAYLGNEWRFIYMLDDTIDVGGMPTHIPILNIEYGQMTGPEFSFLSTVTDTVQEQLDDLETDLGATYDTTATKALLDLRQAYIDTNSWDATQTWCNATFIEPKDSTEYATPYDLSLKQDYVDTNSWDATKTDIVDMVVWGDTADVLITVSDTAVTSAYIGSRADSATVLYWADTTLTNGVATDYDISANTVWVTPVYGFRGNAYTAGDYAYSDMGEHRQFSANFGFLMPKAGSIVGISMSVECTAKTTNGIARAKSLINAVDKLTSDVTITAVGWYNTYATAAPGTYAFAAGDMIQIKVAFPTFVGTLRATLITVYVRMP